MLKDFATNPNSKPADLEILKTEKKYPITEGVKHKLQLRINIETQMRRGKVAMSKNMSGSARQYFEKAKLTLEKQNYADEYIITRLGEIEELLSQIATDLKSAKLDDVKKKQSEENDDLDALFAPKKKW